MSGIYDGALTREQFMFLEMRKVAQMTIQGMTEEEILSRVYDDNLFQYPTQRAIKSKCRACARRPFRRPKLLQNRCPTRL